MNSRIKYSGTLLSLVICIIFTLAFLFTDYFRNYETRLGLSFILVGVHLVTLATGALFLIFSFNRWRSITNTFLYNFIGTFDSCFGLFGILCSIFWKGTEPVFLVTFSVSFIVGVLLVSLLYLRKG